MKCDIDKYASGLSHFNLSKEQTERVLRAVWSLMESQVDQAFGKHTVQLAQKAKRKSLAKSSSPVIDSSRAPLRKSFNQSSAGRKQTQNAS